MIKTVRFFYNGIKINGEKNLIKMNIRETADGTIMIEHDYHWATDFEQSLYAIVDHKYSQPRYWGDHGETVIEVTADNPLYKCFRYMVLCAKRRELKMYGKDYSEIDSLIRLYPSSADPDKVAEAKEFIKKINEERANAKREAEEEENKKRQEIFNAQKAQKTVIETLAKYYPITSDCRFKVRICWSEHPAFYDWNDDELELSTMATNLVFKKLDVRDEEGEYFKTKFMIIDTTCEYEDYTGRYDLGDEDNGLFNHMIDFVKCVDEDEKEDRLAYIQKVIDDAEKNEPKVTMFGWMHEFIKRYKNNK